MLTLLKYKSPSVTDAPKASWVGSEEACPKYNAKKLFRYVDALFTFVIFVATVFMLAWFVARVPNPEIPAKVFISALSDGDNHEFSR